MADHLPQDPRDWPNDPYRVLGVAPDSTETDLKRAYTKLIREFKPEHHPEEFRRVREAYETAHSRLRWYSGALFEMPPRPQPTPDPPESRVVEPRPQALPDPEETAWSLAQTGQLSEAYYQLAKLTESRVDRVSLALRMYWLLAVSPGIDKGHTRHDWLAHALVQSRFTGTARELYRRELDANPETALAGPYLRLVETSDAPAFACLALARMRLMPAGQTASWTPLDVDVVALAARAKELDESAWLSFLVGVMSYATFTRPAPLYHRCRELIAGLRHLELHEGWAFDQLDEQQTLADIWESAGEFPSLVLEVIRNAWMGDGIGWRGTMALASDWARADPAAALLAFDTATLSSRTPSLLGVFTRLLEENSSPPTTGYPPEVIRGLVRGYLARMGQGGYWSFRSGLLRLLVAEAIDPREAVRACFDDPAYAVQVIAEQLRTDRHLRSVWQTAMFTAYG